MEIISLFFTLLFLFFAHLFIVKIWKFDLIALHFKLMKGCLVLFTGGSPPSNKGGWSSRPWDKGEGRFKFFFFRPFGPQFGLKIRGGTGPPGPLPWIRHCCLLISTKYLQYFDRCKWRFNIFIFWGIELECGSPLDKEMTNFLQASPLLDPCR